MTTKISIKNRGNRTAIIDVEGIIGLPEGLQFGDQAEKTATYGRISAQIEEISRIDAAKVIVNIRSTGGDVGDAILIHDALCGLKSQVVTKCYGYVASAATIIAQAASPGCREISSNSLYLIHKSSCSTEGNSTELSQALNLLDKTDNRIAEIYAARAGKDASWFTALMDENNGKGRWLTPKETVEAGLADRVIKKSPMPGNAAHLISSPGLPPVPEILGDERKAGIIQHWKSLMGILGPGSLADGRPTNGEAGPAEKELALRDSAIVSLINDKVQLDAMYAGKIEDLNNRIAILEAQNAKFRAITTQTKSKEDPSYGERRHSLNEEAYSSDIRNFR